MDRFPQHPLSPSAAQAAEAVRARFRAAATSPRGLFNYPTGGEALSALGYAPALIAGLPAEVLECYCGVGNPFASGLPLPGWRVLDVGCGAGVDVLLAAFAVGPAGHAEGLECTPEMLDRARRNAERCGAANVAFRQGGAEGLPYPDASFDLVISNGVLNLVPDKERALREVARVLRPGGRLQMADQILEADAPAFCPLPLAGGSRSGWAC